MLNRFNSVVSFNNLRSNALKYYHSNIENCYFFVNRSRLCRRESVGLLEQKNSYILTKVMYKIRKGSKNVNIKGLYSEGEGSYVEKARKKVNELEEILKNELERHFSPTVDIRAIQDIVVQLDGGQKMKLNRLARIILKTPTTVQIDFTSHPTAVKPAKIAITTHLNVNPQQDGICLHITVPKMTRSRREEIAKSAKVKLLNEFRLALNEVYLKHIKIAETELKSEDDLKLARMDLLTFKRGVEVKGLELIEEYQKKFFHEYLP